MSDADRYAAEQAERARLESQIVQTRREIQRVEAANRALEVEIKFSYTAIGTMCVNVGHLQAKVVPAADTLSSAVSELAIDTTNIYHALEELSQSYFTFKNLGMASKHLTRFNDEYHTRFSNHHQLRRIALGYIIGVDQEVISNENMRLMVEKMYLQNTEYWLAYALSAVMLWVSNESEACQRAVTKALACNTEKASLFFLLINLRFGRLGSARQWYLLYLDRVSATNVGDEWKYLLQACFSGAFGSDKDFEKKIISQFGTIIGDIQAMSASFGLNCVTQSYKYAKTYPHYSEHAFPTLRRISANHDELTEALNRAERNAVLAQYYIRLYDHAPDLSADIFQRIENVLYSLIQSYDDSELEVIKKIRYNEQIIAAEGNLEDAQTRYNELSELEFGKSDVSQSLVNWAFSEDDTQTDISVKRFSFGVMKHWIKKGLWQFVSEYRQLEPSKINLAFDGFSIDCHEDDLDVAEEALDKYYENNKRLDILRDQHVLIFGGMCIIAVVILVISIATLTFNPAILMIAALLAGAGGFLLYQRLGEFQKAFQEKKRLGMVQLRRALAELKAWRRYYREADSCTKDMFDAVDRF